jgi:hypothetical protein
MVINPNAKIQIWWMEFGNVIKLSADDVIEKKDRLFTVAFSLQNFS